MPVSSFLCILLWLVVVQGFYQGELSKRSSLIRSNLSPGLGLTSPSEDQDLTLNSGHSYHLSPGITGMGHTYHIGGFLGLTLVCLHVYYVFGEHGLSSDMLC